MRTRKLPTCLAQVAGRIDAWLAIGFLLFPLSRSLAEESSPNHVSRLGFTFDQQAHDAAVAKEKKNRSAQFLSEDDPPPDVLRLPKYVVNEQPLTLESDDVLTPEGRLEVAKKRHLSPLYQKTMGPLAAVAGLLVNPLGGWNSNGAEAMALYEDNRTKQRNLRMNELAELSELAELAKKSKAPRDKPAKP